MKTTLIEIKHNGVYWVAVLNGGRVKNSTLNGDNLEIRITNGKREGCDTSTEEAALIEIRKREQDQPKPYVPLKLRTDV